MLVPGRRMGNSSSLDVIATLEPGMRIGNSSSSAAGMGIGPEMVPRMDLWDANFGYPAAEPGLKIGGMVAMAFAAWLDLHAGHI